VVKPQGRARFFRARASHVSVGLAPLDPVALTEHGMNFTLGKAQIAQHGGGLNSQFDLLACRLGVGLALAFADHRLLRLFCLVSHLSGWFSHSRNSLNCHVLPSAACVKEADATEFLSLRLAGVKSEIVQFPAAKAG